MHLALLIKMFLAWLWRTVSHSAHSMSITNTNAYPRVWLDFRRRKLWSGRTPCGNLLNYRVLWCTYILPHSITCCEICYHLYICTIEPYIKYTCNIPGLVVFLSSTLCHVGPSWSFPATAMSTRCLPPSFTNVYRLFLRTTSASVLNHSSATRNLRKLWKPSFRDAAVTIRALESREERNQHSQDTLEKWLKEWYSRSKCSDLLIEGWTGG